MLDETTKDTNQHEFFNHNRAPRRVRGGATEGWPEGRESGGERVKLLRLTRIEKGAGPCLDKPSGAAFSNPFTSELARDCENSSHNRSAIGALLLRSITSVLSPLSPFGLLSAGSPAQSLALVTWDSRIELHPIDERKSEKSTYSCRACVYAQAKSRLV